MQKMTYKKTRNILALAVSALAMLSLTGANAETGKTATGASSKPIMKITTPSGAVIYTDRSLQGVTVKKVETLRGAISEKILAQSPEAAAATDASAKNPAKEVVASMPQSKASAAAPSNLIDWAKQQEALMAKQNKQIVDAKEAISKVNCDQARKASVEAEKGRVAKVNDKGEPEYLTDDQLAMEKSRLKIQISDNCS